LQSGGINIPTGKIPFETKNPNDEVIAPGTVIIAGGNT
jgi:hypothetical protein